VRHAFPGCRFDLDNLLGEGDRVAFTWTFTGTHTGNLGPVPPTGRQVTVTGVNVERIADGRVAEYWSSPDNLRMFQQLGLVPRSASSPPAGRRPLRSGTRAAASAVDHADPQANKHPSNKFGRSLTAPGASALALVKQTPGCRRRG
jgi:SnoaL-like polyketide cyclase